MCVGSMAKCVAASTLVVPGSGKVGGRPQRPGTVVETSGTDKVV